MPKRLTISALIEKLHQYNRMSILLVAIYIPAAVVFWIMSYLIPTAMVEFLLEAFNFQPPPWLQPTIVGVFLFLLILEIWRERDGLFDLQEFHNSDFDFGPTVTYMQHGGNFHGAGYLAAGTHIAWLVTQTLLLAPHTTMLAIRRWRSRVVVNEEVAETAVQLYQQMSKAANWIPVPPGREQELAYLDRAGLLWSRMEGKLQVVKTLRYEPPKQWHDWFEKA